MKMLRTMIHPFFDPKKIVMQRLTKNPNPKALDVLREYQGEDVDYGELASNETPGAISLMLERTGGKLNDLQLQQLSGNTSDEALALLVSGEVPISWISLSANSNPKAIKLLKENEEKISWTNFNRNSNPDVCDLLEPHRLSHMLCFNSSDRALDILNANPQHMLSYFLASNPNPKALKMIEDHNLMNSVLYSPSSLAMNLLAKNTNPAAINLLVKNMDRFQWREIWSNPSPDAVNLIRACYTGTWHQKCPYMAIDLRDKTEARLYHAMDNWASFEMCSNPNPEVREFLRFSKIHYGVLSENPIIFN